MLKKITLLLVVLMVSTTLFAQGAQEAETSGPVKLTYLCASGTDETQASVMADAFMAANPDVIIEIETRPGGGDGDNIVKTRLATGEMTDLFYYNAGSLLQALNPSKTLVDIADQPFMANVDDAFKMTVAQGDAVYGIPNQTAMGGGMLYNKKIYRDLGLEVPETWAEFAANNEKIKAAGITPVIGTFGDSWTAQLFVLADYYNVQAAYPTFAEDYTANKAKYADIPAAMAGFSHLEEAYKKGWYQSGYETAKYDQGLEMLATGKGAHYPMLSFALTAIQEGWPENIDDIGFMAQPGTSKDAYGATIWMLSANYIPKTTTGAKLDAVLRFFEFVVSPEGVAAMSAGFPPSGPYLIKGAELPEDVLGAVKDIKGYIDSGASAPALEFLSPVKGPRLEQFCVAVGTGQMSPADAAANYDKDVVNQAKQLGLQGW